MTSRAGALCPPLLRPFLRVTITCALFAICSPLAAPAGAQVAPDQKWRTLTTEHFRIHFPEGLEDRARRAAADGELAWRQLAAELAEPRGMVDVVIADDVDASNGSATPFPSNRIVLYTAPPVDASSLRYTADWGAMVMTHELAHIFHLDRVRGIWRVGQAVFGRNPLLFPNAYAPRWLTEGIAVYYETRLTELGRLAGSEHRMIAHASALQHTLPQIHQLSSSTVLFPGGQTPYVYGSLFVDHLARTRGPERLRQFIDASSGALIPLWLNRAAVRGFGISFSRAFEQWRDSLALEAAADPRSLDAPLPGWRELTTAGLYARSPRWVTTDSLLYAGSPPREITGVYTVTRAGRERRLGRRNSLSPQVPLAGGGILYSQLEFTDPYRLRSDLWIERDGDERRLTRGARLIHPDARADGAIVAVQYTGDGTRLVRLDADGSALRVLAEGSPDLLWSEPQWSPDGARIAAVRWRRGGVTDVVVFDTAGDVRRVIGGGRTSPSKPTWTPDSRAVVFSSDAGGATDLYITMVDAEGAAGEPRRLSAAPTGLFDPAVSPDGRSLAAVLFRADGYHVGMAPMPPVDGAPDSAIVAAGALSVDAGPVERAGSDVRDYSPWRSLLPTHWIPLFEAGLEDGTRFGLMTSGSDPVGRHQYDLNALVPTDGGGVTGRLSYLYSGLGQPQVGLYAEQYVEDYFRRTFEDSSFAGAVRRTGQVGDLSLRLARPRARTSASITFGAGLESYTHRVVNASVIGPLLAASRQAFPDAVQPRVFVSGAWANTRRPAFSISPEDGVLLSGSVVHRWTRYTGTTTAGPMELENRTAATAIGAINAYKSLDLPGFAHHVAAVRVAGGAAGTAASLLQVGGTSGAVAPLLPGYALGEGRRTFGVRGFPARSLLAHRVLAGSAEYRAPLAVAARGLGLLPLFLDRSAAVLFADAGAAECTAGSPCAPVSRLGNPIASVGAELHLVAAVLSWDTPFRIRLGVAKPVAGMERTNVVVSDVSFYVTGGLSF